jgi:hypothetical protein
MSDERTPDLEDLFAAANRELTDEAFVVGVVAKTSKWSAHRLAIALVVCLLAVPAALLVAAPLSESLHWLMQALTEPLVDTGSGVASRIVLPMNNIGAALALAVLALRAITRLLFTSRN